MRKLKVYLDTSAVSYLYQQDTSEKMKDTPELWNCSGRDAMKCKFLILCSMRSVAAVRKSWISSWAI